MHPFPGGMQIPHEGLQQVSPKGQRLGPHWAPSRGATQKALLLVMTHSSPLAHSTTAQVRTGSEVGAGDAAARKAPPKRTRKESGPMVS